MSRGPGDRLARASQVVVRSKNTGGTDQDASWREASGGKALVQPSPRDACRCGKILRSPKASWRSEELSHS
jgi:hypothetical protein